jgi:hypothetical protein
MGKLTEIINEKLYKLKLSSEEKELYDRTKNEEVERQKKDLINKHAKKEAERKAKRKFE